MQIPANGEVEVKFPAQRVDPKVSLHQGQVLLSGVPDPAEFDDRRYFTFVLKPPVNVLVVSDDPADSKYIADAIDPIATPPGTPRPFRVDRVLTKDFADKSDDLGKRYRCVFLNNVSPERAGVGTAQRLCPRRRRPCRRPGPALLARKLYRGDGDPAVALHGRGRPA